MELCPPVSEDSKSCCCYSKEENFYVLVLFNLSNFIYGARD